MGGADVFDFNYSVPLNAMNGTLQLRYAPNSNKVTQAPFNNFDIHGSSQLYEISYRQPLVRTSREEFALSLGFSYQDGQTFTFAGPTPFSLGPDSEGNTRTRVLKFGQDYIRRDVSGAWSLRSLFSIGLDVFNPTINSGNIPDGRFFSWLGQVQRLQAFSQDNFLILQAEAQLTPNGLLPSQQFVIGGGESLRGYRQNVRAGDNGVRFSAEDRQTLMRDETGASTVQFASFLDLGTVWNSGNNPNTLQGQNFLVGLGVGLIWELLPRLNVRVDYAIPLVDISDRGNNAQDRGLYFNLNYQL
ncbi:ShlB/FhaC/HecB family hemolysin secretion/activation protein [Nostoc sphaeroides]|uniref:ShlB/FhaC/HecB family hemolysin secretion/activation protein n=1 Tax=Nostoc sphaeroides TaxID=446679 RepID=UPI002B3FFE26|nr:ShlB/FhaC/HecB family hemolysin secretion/activation protein [Nostoc sphaeroides]